MQISIQKKQTPSDSEKPIASSYWFVYIIRTKKGKLYTGITTNVQRRLSEHQNSTKGAKYFRSDKVDALLLTEVAIGRSAATIREAEIKKLSPAQKMCLIRLQSPCPKAKI